MGLTIPKDNDVDRLSYLKIIVLMECKISEL